MPRSPRPLLALAALPLLVAACGDDDAETAVEPVEPVEEADELVTPQLDGLEVTVTGNVTELLGDEGFQIDKDGLGDATTPAVDPEDGIDSGADYFVGVYDLYDAYDRDYDYYDLDYYTAFDVELDEFDENAVVVITPGGSEVEAGGAVQVNGTMRYFDEVELEEVYDLDLEDDLYGSYQNQYVIVADAVRTVPAQRDTTAATADDTSTTTPSDSTTTTADADDDIADPGIEPDDVDGSTTTTEPGEDAEQTTTTAAG